MEKEIKNIIERPLNEIGIKIEDISIIKEEVDTILIIISSETKEVDVDLCVKTSNIVNKLLDSYRDKYEIDICSKGEKNE